MPSLVITRDTVSVRLQSERLEIIRRIDPVNPTNATRKIRLAKH